MNALTFRPCALLALLLFPFVRHASADIVAGGLSLQGTTPASETAAVAGDQAALLEPVVQAFNQGKRAEFDAAYAEAAKKSDKLPAAAIFLAKLQIESGKLADATATVEAHLVKSPEDPEAFIALGEIAIRSGRWTDAWLQLKHADELVRDRKLRSVRITSVVRGLVQLRADVAERRRDWAEAETQFTRLADLRPESAMPMWRIGRIKALAGDAEAGVAKMAEARKRDESLPSPEWTVAQIMADKPGSITDPAIGGEAEKWFQRAIKANRDDATVWAGYLKWLLIAGRGDDCLRLVGKLDKGVREDRTIRLIEGLAARYTGDLATAETVLAALHQSVPEDLEVADQLTLVLIESDDEGKRGRALQLSELNLRKAGGVENAVATAAWVQLKLGSVDVADRLLGELSARIAMSPQTAFYAARVLQAKGQPDDARRILRAAVDSPGIFVQRGIVRAELEAAAENDAEEATGSEANGDDASGQTSAEAAD